MGVTPNDTHQPVFLREFLEAANPQSGQRWIDGTFGRGGHTKALLERGASVLALDQDGEAEAAAVSFMAGWPQQFDFVRENFRAMKHVCEKRGWAPVNGILLDLGVSSPQFDTASRGFSLRQDGPLDMRMDARSPFTASDLLRDSDEAELARIFRVYGDEPDARRLARMIVTERAKQPIERTKQLADLIEKTVPWRKAKGVHPATRVFQALRLAVNREIEALETVLPDASELLVEGGVLAVISFHSGEDRRVKHFFRDHGDEEIDTEKAGYRIANPERWFDRVGRFMPSEEEVEQNPRARSARLRMAWRIQS